MGYYKLSYSGQEVNTAVERILNLDPDEFENVSHIIDVDSTEAVPYDPANLKQIGMYRVMYLDPAKVPPELAQMHPAYVTVCIVKDPSSGDEQLAQMVPCVNCKVYVRLSDDAGQSFSEWDYPKEISSEEINAMFDADDETDATASVTKQAAATVNTNKASSQTATARTVTTTRRTGYAM